MRHLPTTSLFYIFLGLLTSSNIHSIDDPNLKDILNKAFKARLAEVMDQSQHASTSGNGVGNVDQSAAAFLAGLDEWEKECEYWSDCFPVTRTVHLK